jgi:serine/threonine protein kinase
MVHLSIECKNKLPLNELFHLNPTSPFILFQPIIIDLSEFSTNERQVNSGLSEYEEDEMLNYQYMKDLNSGSTTTVDLYRDIRNDRNVAIKTTTLPRGDLLSFRDQDIEKQIQMEVVALQNVKGHSGVIELYDVIEKSETRQILLVLEYCPDGDLMDRLDSPLPEKIAKVYLSN